MGQVAMACVGRTRSKQHHDCFHVDRDGVEWERGWLQSYWTVDRTTPKHPGSCHGDRGGVGLERDWLQSTVDRKHPESCHGDRDGVGWERDGLQSQWTADRTTPKHPESCHEDRDVGSKRDRMQGVVAAV